MLLSPDQVCILGILEEYGTVSVEAIAAAFHKTVPELQSAFDHLARVNKIQPVDSSCKEYRLRHG
jgi:hypothetical protein